MVAVHCPHVHHQRAALVFLGQLAVVLGTHHKLNLLAVFVAFLAYFKILIHRGIVLVDATEAVDAVDVYVLGQASFGKLLFLLLRPLVVGLVLLYEADGFGEYYDEILEYFAYNKTATENFPEFDYGKT